MDHIVRILKHWEGTNKRGFLCMCHHIALKDFSPWIQRLLVHWGCSIMMPGEQTSEWTRSLEAYLLKRGFVGNASGFKSCGIFPLNTNQFPGHVFFPGIVHVQSEVTEVEAMTQVMTKTQTSGNIRWECTRNRRHQAPSPESTKMFWINKPHSYYIAGKIGNRIARVTDPELIQKSKEKPLTQKDMTIRRSTLITETDKWTNVKFIECVNWYHKVTNILCAVTARLTRVSF
jgi:hypothetical protein